MVADRHRGDAGGRQLEPLAERGVAGRPFVGIDEVSPSLAKAVVAIEDRRFWDHAGVDPVGIMRAA